MDITELELIESKEGVAFSFKHETKTIGVKGKPAAVDRALRRIEGHRDLVANLLRQRQGEPDEPDVDREISFNVPGLAIQRMNYVRWFSAHNKYYQPSESELEKMFAVLEEGDLVIPDFAHSFSVRKPNGLIVSVDRKGRIDKPSPYSPALRQTKCTTKKD